MKRSLHQQILRWLALAIIPVITTGLWAAGHAESQLARQVDVSIAGTARLEADQINHNLDAYEREATNLAGGVFVKTFTSQLIRARSDSSPAVPIGGTNGFRLIDPLKPLPLQNLATLTTESAQNSGSDLVAMAIVDAEGEVLGHSPDFRFSGHRDSADAAIASSQPRFGSTFLDETSQEALVTIAAPIQDRGDNVAALVIEVGVGPIVASAIASQRYGATNEAFLTQRTDDGDVVVITRRRFGSEAPFELRLPADAGLPATEAITSPAVTVGLLDDYRGGESIAALQRIERTGWGLVIQVSRDEALGPIAAVRRLIIASTAAASLVILAGWALILRPMTKRLKRMADASERIADGRFDERIDDRGGDEIQAVSDSIDRLAAELGLDTVRRARAEAELIHQATHDVLTDLFNRQAAVDVLDRELARCDENYPVSVLFVDLDRFKVINDTIGHRAGDELLQGIAQRLERAVEPELLARWGGDEFLVVLPGYDGAGADKVRRTIEEELNDTVVADGHQVVISASIGPATATKPISVDLLVKQADNTMFDAKGDRRRSDRTRCTPTAAAARTLFGPAMPSGAGSMTDDAGAVAVLVEQALANNQFELWYQPIYSVPDLDCIIPTGAEALIRLRETDGTIVSPNSFVPVISDQALGRRLDEWVTTTALGDLRRWMKSGLIDADFQISVNLCQASTSDTDYPAFLANSMKRFSVTPAQVIIELPETATVVKRAVADELRRLGVAVAIDDFGLSNSNIDRIQDLDAEIVKLDRRWLGPPDKPIEPQQLELLTSIVQMCQSLGSHVVAEGIETTDQLETLLSLRVSEVQGFLLSKPLAPAAFDKLLDHYRSASLVAVGD